MLVLGFRTTTPKPHHGQCLEWIRNCRQGPNAYSPVPFVISDVNNMLQRPVTNTVPRVQGTAPSESYVWSRSIAGIVGSNPTEGMDVSLLCWFVLYG
jgi:hypothetical protein